MTAVPETPVPAGKQVSRLERFLLAPTSIELAILYVFLGMHLALGTDALVPLTAGHVPFITFLAGATLLAIRLAFAVLLFALCSCRPRAGPWLHAFAIITLFLIIHCTPWCFALRVWLAEDDLMRSVKGVKQLVDHGKAPRNLPVMITHAPLEARMWSVSPDGRDVYFHTTVGSGFLTATKDYLVGGVVYSESGKPDAHWPSAHFQHLYGPWWRWRLPD